MKDNRALLVMSAILCACLTPSRAEDGLELLKTLHGCEKHSESMPLREAVTHLNRCIASQVTGTAAVIVVNTNPVALVIRNMTTGWTNEFTLLKAHARYRCREITATILDRPVDVMATTNMSLLSTLALMKDTAGVRFAVEGNVIVLNPAPEPLELREYVTPPGIVINGTNGYDKFFSMIVSSVLSEYAEVRVVASNRLLVLEMESIQRDVARLMNREVPNQGPEGTSDPGRAAHSRQTTAGSLAPQP